MKGQLRRKEERQALTVSLYLTFLKCIYYDSIAFSSFYHSLFCLQRRIVALETEIDKGMDQWEQKQELAKEMEMQKNSLLLKRKGNSLLKKKE